MDTIAAVATPAGEGALGIVRIAGPEALSIALQMTGKTELLERTATKITLRDLDEGIAIYYPARTSPIGEELVELTLHGSRHILERTMERALTRARPARPGEFTQRAFLNGKMDLAQAEAVCDLIKSKTEAAHRAAYRQLAGGLSAAVRNCRSQLFELLVRVEACLDHPEEDIESLTPTQALSAIEAARAPIADLAASYARGRLAAEGPRLAIVGRPNAGKSTLFNALLGRERAIVRPEPGTTRDTLEEPLLLGGLPAVLIDTAGLREDAGDPAEREGVERSRRALEGCDAAIWVVDGSRPPVSDLALARAIESKPHVVALTKSDLGRAAGHDGVSLCAATGAGLDALLAALSERLGGADASAETVTSARHRDALEAAAAELAAAADDVRALGRAWEDRAACRLREAARRLGEILGEGTTEETLSAVFARFCVGK